MSMTPLHTDIQGVKISPDVFLAQQSPIQKVHRTSSSSNSFKGVERESIDSRSRRSVNKRWTPYVSRRGDRLYNESSHNRERSMSPVRKNERTRDLSRTPEKSNVDKKASSTFQREFDHPESKRVAECPMIIRAVTVHSLPMKGVEYLKYIKDGVKPFEGRINGPAVKKMKIGDQLKLTDHRAQMGITCEITSKDVFYKFEEMLRAKGSLNMLPQLRDRANVLSLDALIQEGAKIYKQFPGSNRVSTQGCVAIGVKFLNEFSERRR